MFPVAGPLDFVAMQKDVLAFWARHDVFKKRVDQNRGGPRYSFLDGPITANNPMGVHQLADYIEAFVAVKLGDGELCERAVVDGLQRAEST